jgi:hypothetical protein
MKQKTIVLLSLFVSGCASNFSLETAQIGAEGSFSQAQKIDSLRVHVRSERHEKVSGNIFVLPARDNQLYDVVNGFIVDSISQSPCVDSVTVIKTVSDNNYPLDAYTMRYYFNNMGGSRSGFEMQVFEGDSEELVFDVSAIKVIWSSFENELLYPVINEFLDWQKKYNCK